MSKFQCSTAQRYHHPRCTNSSGIVHISLTYMARTGFLEHNAQNIVDIQEQDTSNFELLQDLKRIVR